MNGISQDKQQRLLAAYGTLRPGCGGQERLGIKLEDLGPVHLPGRLWLTPSIEHPGRVAPGFIPEDGVVSRGHLLTVPAEAWPLIDAWENYSAEDPDSSQYRRQSLLTIEGRQAEVYILQAEKLNFIRGGDWLRYAHHQKAVPVLSPKISWTPDGERQRRSEKHHALTA